MHISVAGHAASPKLLKAQADARLSGQNIRRSGHFQAHVTHVRTSCCVWYAFSLTASGTS